VLAEKVFIGQRIDLEHYKGLAIVDHEFELLNSDGTEFDFSEYDQIVFELSAKRHGKILAEVDQEVPADNILLLNVENEVFDIRPTLYSFEVYADTSASPSVRVLLFYGIIELT
jgi:hypothetical protein